MSNVFLSSSLIYLASVHAGCVDDEGEIVDECDGKAYGFQPASLITNIAVVSGLLAAFFLPVLGAIIDFTPHRRSLGIATAVLMTLIQGVQIGTVQATWFPMALLQAVVGFLFFVQILSTFAYLPEMARTVGEYTDRQSVSQSAV
jgi:MFS-type transporter involved in bile tolerance (Atg22 family)